jgi:hypothetical protein
MVSGTTLPGVMAGPKHRNEAARRQRRQRGLLAAILVVVLAAVTASLFIGSMGDDEDDPELVSDSTLDAVDTTTTSEQARATIPTLPATTTTVAPTTTTVAPATTTTSPPPPATGSWFAVVQSAPKGGADRNALAAAVAPYGDRGRVIDTDSYRSGNGQAPDYLPAGGLLAAVVGPFASYGETRAWCASHQGEYGCHARQLVPR